MISVISGSVLRGKTVKSIDESLVLWRGHFVNIYAADDCPKELQPTTCITKHWTGHVCLVNIIMVALCNRADHYIFALWFLLSSFLPHLISAAVDWMSTILRHMVWP